MKKSKLKNNLINKNITIGSWLTIPSQEIIELFSKFNFEWLTIDMEHASISIESVINLIGHIQGNGMQALVRVSKNEEVIIKRVLDAGADGIIVPMINSKDDALKAIDYSKYPPLGKRGVGLNRAHGYGKDFDKYLQWVDNEIVIIAQIEHIDGVNNLDEILEVNHIDGILVGPYDLSASMGFPGQYSRKEVLNALNHVEKTTKKSKKSLGFHVIESDHNYVKEKIKKGFNLIAYSMDFLFFGDKIMNEMNNLKFFKK